MGRHTRIICTLGPSSANAAMMKKMAIRGMDVARLNFSHGSHRQHQKLIDNIRLLNTQADINVKLLQDLEGFRIRVCQLHRPIHLEKNQTVYLTVRPSVEKDFIPFDYKGSLSKVKKGYMVFIDDGKIAMRVKEQFKSKLKCEVVQEGTVKSRKGVIIPRLHLSTNILTEKDKKDIAFGISNRIDYIAQSFVRNEKDILSVSRLVKSQWPKCRIIAKIEDKSGVKNIDSIIEACDGIMVARGDLGVSLPIYQIPIIQKDIIRRCNKKRKIVITATQMLDNMIEHSRPTRAEVSDVANAILDGTDYVMLSGETAAGQFPSRSIKVMRQIIDFTEQSTLYRKR